MVLPGFTGQDEVRWPWILSLRTGADMPLDYVATKQSLYLGKVYDRPIGWVRQGLICCLILEWQGQFNGGWWW